METQGCCRQSLFKQNELALRNGRKRTCRGTVSTTQTCCRAWSRIETINITGMAKVKLLSRGP